MNMERLQSALLTAAALVMAVALVHREFYSTTVGRERSAPTTAANWREIIPAGRPIGDTSARVKIIEFADLQCPFCKYFNGVVRSVVAKYPKDVELVFVHDPLPMHPFAAQAARAAECAASQGRFSEMVNALYDAQSLLGSQPWSSFAMTAGVPDVSRFADCVRDTIPLSVIDRGVQMAKHFNVVGTPTVFVNDRRFAGAPSDTELGRAVESILDTRASSRR